MFGSMIVVWTARIFRRLAMKGEGGGGGSSKVYHVHFEKRSLYQEQVKCHRKGTLGRASQRKCVAKMMSSKRYGSRRATSTLDYSDRDKLC